MTAADRPTDLRHGWPLVIAGFVISFFVIGGGIDTVGVFLNAIATAAHWSRSSLSLGVSVGGMMAALSVPGVGILIDRFGVRVPMSAGLALLGAGFLILISMQQPWHFVAANVFLGPGFAACALLPLTIAVTMRITDRTALALGIVGAGASAGTLVLAPLLQWVIEAVGWRTTYIVLGAAILVIPLPFLAFAMPRGRLRTGDSAATGPAEGSVLRSFRQRGAGALAMVMVLPGLVAFSISVHLVPYLTGLGHTGGAAAAALGASVGVSALGKIGGGLAGDRFGARRMLRCALALDVIAVALLHHANTPLALGGFVLCYGLAVGTQVAVIPAVAVLVLGPDRFGTVFGILQLAAMLASAVGPVGSGLIFDATGQYGGAILLWLGALVVATAIGFGIPAARHAAAATQERAVA